MRVAVWKPLVASAALLLGQTAVAAAPVAAAGPITITADMPAFVPAGHLWSFNDFFPRSLRVVQGTTIQFVIEGFSLTIVSGIIGFLAGYLLCGLVNLAPRPARFSGMIVTPGTAVLAVVALTTVGILAALYPAARAAALPPVESLRYEV